MKHSLLLLLAVPFLCVSCYTARIVTVSPYSAPTYSYGYSTTVTVPRAKVVSTTTQVYAASQDISLQLDLQAVGAAFSQCNTVREFENLLNNSSYMLSNLDLNNDGYVDYLRVMETFEGSTHLFIIQAVLGTNIFQDVATIVVENPGLATYHIELIGNPYIYGPSYYVRPVFYAHPPILGHLARFGYDPWRSPYYWGYYPAHFRRPAPVYLNHYQAYCHNFMSNHHYCHEAQFPAACHYPGYSNMGKEFHRNDYAQQHPERSFTVRNAEKAGANSAVQRAANAANSQPYNARNIRTESDATKNTSVSSTREVVRNTRTTTANTTGGSTRSAATPSAPANTASKATTTSKSSTVNTTSRSSASNSGSGSQTTVKSNVGRTGSSSTSISTRSSAGTTSTVNRNNSSRSSAASAPSTRSSSTATTRSTSGSTTTKSSTTTSSRSTGTSGGSTRR